jgi:hypothetical protein
MKFKVGDRVVFVDGRTFEKGCCVENGAEQPEYIKPYIGIVHVVVNVRSKEDLLTVDPETPVGSTCYANRFVLEEEYNSDTGKRVKKTSWKFEMEGNSEVCFTVEAPNRKQAFEEFVRYIGYKFVG